MLLWHLRRQLQLQQQQLERRNDNADAMWHSLLLPPSCHKIPQDPVGYSLYGQHTPGSRCPASASCCTLHVTCWCYCFIFGLLLMLPVAQSLANRWRHKHKHKHKHKPRHNTSLGSTVACSSLLHSVCFSPAEAPLAHEDLHIWVLFGYKRGPASLCKRPWLQLQLQLPVPLRFP